MNTVTYAVNAAGPRLVYICSAARSGSTVTDMFLGGHPAAASLGEINFLGKAIRLGQDCTCGVEVRDCPNWRKVFDLLQNDTGIDLLARPYGLRLWDARAVHVIDYAYQTRTRLVTIFLRKAWMEARDRLPAPLRRHCTIPPAFDVALANKMRLTEAIARCWNKTIVLDSSKNAREAVELYRLWPDKVRVILLTRDGRGVYLSQRKSARSRAESVRGWLHYYRRAMPRLEKHVATEALFRLRYEDLASGPEETGRNLCRFMGVDFDPILLELARGERHMVAGNDTRFAAQKWIRLDERWRSELVGDELAFFERMGGEMNRRLGYN
ncbi:MAG: sulfotransferase [Methylococcales bacterium]